MINLLKILISNTQH